MISTDGNDTTPIENKMVQKLAYLNHYRISSTQEAENHIPYVLYRDRVDVSTSTRLEDHMDDYLKYEILEVWGLTITQYLALTKLEMLTLCERATIQQTENGASLDVIKAGIKNM